MTGIGLLTSVHSNAQLKKFYSLKDDVAFDTVRLSFEASSGSCYFKNTSHSSPLNIYGNPDLDKINPSYHTDIRNNTCNVNLKLEEFQSASLDEGFTFASFFSGGTTARRKVEKDYWKIYLSDQKVYDLNLQYGMGEAYLDFSGTAISKVKINTGNANVKVGYSLEHINPIAMDTFMVKVDLGSLEADKINYLNASKIIAEVRVGNATLDFRKGQSKKCNVDATVGAGNLDIILPDEDVPVIIYVGESPMCGVKLTEGFEEVEKNVYVNMKYRADADDLMTFNVDVTFGNINFTRPD